MQNGLFENAMTDVTGKIRLESEDPRWIQLFSSKCVESVVDGFDVSWYGNRLIEHNISTGNLVQMIGQTSSRLQQVSARKVVPPIQLVEQCCFALHLSSLMLHFIITALSSNAIRKQLQLPETWLEARDSSHFMRADQSQEGSITASDSVQGGQVVGRLIAELAVALDCPVEHAAWMADVRFFCADLLLVMCSSQLYATHSSQHVRNTDGMLSGVCYNSEADLFLNYLFAQAESELRAALGSRQASSTTFSNCLAVQIVRGLLDKQVDGSLLNSGRLSTNLLKKLVAKHGSTVTGGAAAAGGGGKSSTAMVGSPGVGSVMSMVELQKLLWGLLLLLPMSALQRLFRLPDVSSSSVSYPQSSSPSSPDMDMGGGPVDSKEIAFSHTRVAGALDTSFSSSSSLPLPLPVPHSQSLPVDPLQERCLNLLLVLLHNRRTPAMSRPNPFREAFGLLHDLSVPSSPSSSYARLQDSPGGQDGDDLEGGGRYGNSSSSSSGAASHSQQQLMMQGQGGRAGAVSSSSAHMISAARIDVSMQHIISTVAKNLPEESAALLLYSLLQGHPTFLETLIKTDNVGLVLSSCLKGLYTLTHKPSKNATVAVAFNPGEAGALYKSTNQLYVLVVCILMLAQDSAVLQEIGKPGQPTVCMDWYSERQLSHASLMDAALLCLLRTVMHALFRLGDQYLLSNTCAILHNLTPRMQCGLQPYTAERVVRVACQLCNRSIRAHDRRAVGMLQDSREEQLLPEALSALLQVVGTAIRPTRVVHNVHLLYALMHDSHTVDSLFAHPAVAAALESQGLSGSGGQEIVSAVRYYLALLEKKVGENNDNPFTAAQTVQWLVEEMKLGNIHTNTDTTAPTEDHSAAAGGVSAAADGVGAGGGMQRSSVNGLSGGDNRRKFTYQEAASPEEFFLPAIWVAALRNSPEIPWQSLQMTLVDPLSAGFIYLLDPTVADGHQHGQEEAHDGETTASYDRSVADSVDFV